MSCHLAHSVGRTLAAGVLGGSVALASASIGAMPARAADAGLAQDTGDAAQDGAAAPGPAVAPTQQDRGQQDHGKQPAFDPIEERLRYLHGRLRITPAQEPLWANVARAMRENAKSVAPLIRARLQPTKNRTAIDTLDIYEKLGEAQLQGLKDFLAAFHALYDSMSDEQKKIADVMFRTSPLSMVGSIPEFPPEELVELPPSSSYALGAYLPPPVAPVYPPYEYYPPLPPRYPYYYPYYSPWIPGPAVGFGSSFFLFPRHYYHHHVFVPSHRSFRAGFPRTWAGPRVQSFRAR
jgi:LTXXQ motif family protein